MERKEYVARKIEAEMSIFDSRWNDVEEAILDCVWENSYPSPYTSTAKMVHSDKGYTILFNTNEWPLVANCTDVNGAVCCDSCMEFFFTPNETDAEYMNFEMNPVGMLHLGYGKGRGDHVLLEANGEVEITTQVKAGKEWRLMLFIPYSFLKKYFASLSDVIKGNFYKCGDRTPTVHYSTWSPVGTPRPDYHRPEYFGRIILSEEKL